MSHNTDRDMCKHMQTTVETTSPYHAYTKRDMTHLKIETVPSKLLDQYNVSLSLPPSTLPGHLQVGLRSSISHDAVSL